MVGFCAVVEVFAKEKAGAGVVAGAVVFAPNKPPPAALVVAVCEAPA
jgi:hypothetical protein